MKQLVLASGSPRRRDLMKLLGVEFIATATNADETPRPEENAPALVERLSRVKARAAQSPYPDGLIVAADTDVEFDGTILGKPRDLDQAREMLNTLRDRAHSVFTGLTVADGDTRETELVHTRVQMRPFSDAELEAYLATGDSLDKAAGYNVQHQGFRPIAYLNGCFANVMGLPLCRVYHALARHMPLPPPTLDCIHHPEEACSVESLYMG